jgi:GTP-binding protein Era
MQDTPEQVTRAGHVALVGRPNVGKSTLMNALLGEKLSIVTPKAQTTRESVTGILTTDSMQAIFVDTPGLLEPKYALQRAMHETAVEVLRDADLVLLLLDGTRPAELPSAEVVEMLRAKRHRLSCAHQQDRCRTFGRCRDDSSAGPTANSPRRHCMCRRKPAPASTS